VRSAHLENGEDEAAPLDCDLPYSVGYGRPPKHTRFKPGRSGNPKGRPRGSRNLSTEMQKVLTIASPYMSAANTVAFRQ
jgi:hypothetical protein